MAIKQTNRQPKKSGPAVALQAKRPEAKTPLVKRIQRALDAMPPYALPAIVLLALWAICSGVYGNVLYIAEQYSYYSSDPSVMAFLTQQSLGWLWVIGRMLLTLCHYPVWGGLLLAMLLTAAWWALHRILLTLAGGRAAVAALIVPFGFVWWMIYRDLSLYLFHEPGVIMAMPLTLAVVLGALAVVLRMAIKKQPKPTAKPLSLVCLALLVALTLVYAIPVKQNTRLTAKMERQMLQEDWNGMIEAGLSAKKASRPVCCLYAIAMTQSDRLTTELFNLHFQFPALDIVGYEKGHAESGVEYYNYEGDFFAGLVNTCYHECMERIVMDGPSTLKFKFMMLCALLNEEYPLARKYMRLLKETPFQGDFIAKYEPMIDAPELVDKDPMLARVKECMPMEDDFEQHFQTPFFIGYNIALTSGRSNRALNHSLMACIYAKMLGNFIDRVQVIRGYSLPRYYQDAVILFAQNQPDMLRAFNIPDYALKGVQHFIQSARQLRQMDQMERAEALRGDYNGYYPYYMYYENIPDENYIQVNPDEKGGVN